MQGGTSSSEFRIPDSDLEGSVELRVPGPQSANLTLVPSDKILFPRRMLYVEAVLYLAVAASVFSLGYLAGRRRPAAAPHEAADNAADNAVQSRVPVEGRVRLVLGGGEKRGDDGALVIVLPADKAPSAPLPVTGLRPGDPPPGRGDAPLGPLTDLGGAVTHADATGNFACFVPRAGSYRILVRSAGAMRQAGDPLEQSDMAELGKYFDAPGDLLQHCRYHWLTREIRRGGGPIDVEFTE